MPANSREGLTEKAFKDFDYLAQHLNIAADFLKLSSIAIAMIMGNSNFSNNFSKSKYKF